MLLLVKNYDACGKTNADEHGGGGGGGGGASLSRSTKWPRERWWVEMFSPRLQKKEIEKKLIF